MPRTQKAIGIEYLRQNGALPPHTVTLSAIIDLETPYPYPAFARPCPMRPRHGFVESRIVQNKHEARDVFAAALAADPDAELVLMTPINARQSGILTPHSIAIGLGNDGATAGVAGTITLPLAHAAFNWIDLNATRITDTPYIELVQAQTDEIYAVQLRDGPMPPASCDGNWIPQDVTITNVLVADGDLLQWESLIAQAVVGTVVHHPAGTMLSHYAVHAVLNNIPVIFDEIAPTIGSHLQATTQTQTTDGAAIAKGLSYGLTCDMGMCSELNGSYTSNSAAKLHGVCLAVQHASVMQHSTHGAQALGIAAGWLLRFGAAACLGELRHSSRNNPVTRLNRNNIYTDAIANFARARGMLTDAWQDFQYKSWSNNYGGKKWARCTQATLELDRVTRLLLQAPNQQRIVTQFLAQLNITLNLAHNSGFWLNKFGPSNTFNAHAAGDVKSIYTGAFEIAAYVRALNNTTELAALKLPAIRVPRATLGMQCRVKPNVNELILYVGSYENYKSHSISIADDTAASLRTLFASQRQIKSWSGSATQYVTLTRGLLALFPADLQREIRECQSKAK